MTGDNVRRGPDDRDPGDEALVVQSLGDKVRRTLGRVPFTRDAVAAFFCARDPETPTSAKATIMAALAYFIVPTDLVPDFIAALGYTDDATVFYAAWRMLSPHLKDSHRERAEAFLRSDADDPRDVEPDEKS